MKKSATADWQIRNGVYPFTPAALEPIAERISAIESFHVHLGWQHTNHGEVFPSPGQFDFQRAASGKMTVRKWRETRFGKCYPDLTAQVVDIDGRILNDDEMIAGGRGFIIKSSSLILNITAWVGRVKNDDDEALLRGLGFELSRFTFMEGITVQRSHLIWKFFPRWELSASTKPLALRFYEHRIVQSIIRERMDGPGFSYDIQQSAAQSDSTHSPAFLSEHLNYVFES